MVKLPKIPDTPEDFNDMNFIYNQQTGYLFFKQPLNDNSPPIKKKVVPTYNFELRETLFEKFHIDSAHFEYHKTYTMIYERYIGITQDDVKNYVLTLIDIFSHYVWAIPLKDKEGNTIHEELVNIFKNFGPPTKLQADNESEFIISVLKKTCNAFEIKLVHGRARYPQSQEKIERFNQMFSRHLTKMMWDEVSGSQGYHWVDVLSQFIIVYNKAPHEAHKKSPYEAFFGFKMHAVYNTLNTPENKDNTLETNTPGTNSPETNTPGTILPKHISPEHIPPGTIIPKKVIFEPGDKVVVAPNFDNNQKTRKCKLEQTCSITGKVVSMCNNNKTVRVDVNGKIKNFEAKI
ncbi:21636_t:CDS:2 [Gigaspora margarita]|uniref:21636_t:CDS:1 n=1 Tax=Gigaspora margarita TaxID=4874 RepID=A0ABN7V7R3_GIGMA|nr:21636_t:CDS:2 [Gigaspora margarita]